MRVSKTYFMLLVADMDRATRFYRDVLGLTVGYASKDWTELAADGATVALHGGGKAEPRDTGLGFDVDDIDAACRAIATGGGSVVQSPQARPGERITLATVADTEGNRFFLSQPLR